MRPRFLIKAGSALLLAITALCLNAGCEGISAPEHLKNAERYFDAGDYQTAVVELKNALQKDPELGSARLLLARTYDIQAQYPDAFREYERALNLGMSGPDLERGLLSTKLRLGRHQEVVGELSGRSDLRPELIIILADAYLAGEDLSAAAELYEQVADLAGGARGLGTLAWLDGDTDEARALFEQAVTLDPADRESWVRQGELALTGQRYEVAEAAFGRARDLPGGQSSGGLGLARTYLAQGKLDQALSETEAVLAAAPNLYLAHYVQALVKYGLDDVDGAEAALRQVQRVAPDHTPSLFLMGAVKFRQDQLNQAEGSLLRYLSRERGNESAAKLLAVVRARKDDLGGTVEVLKPFAETSEDPQLLAMLGTAQLRQGDVSDATVTLERAVSLAPDAAAFRNQLALSLLSSGEDERAVTELETAIAVDGDQFQSDYLMAMLSLKKGDYPAAEAAADRMVGKSPTLPMGFNLRGAALLGQGNESAARAAFEEALRVAPDFLPAAQNLARLDEAAGDGEAARNRFLAVIGASDDNAAARLALADLAARDGLDQLAREQLEAVVLEMPDSLGARMGLARLALRDSRLEEAGRHVEEAFRLAPEGPDVLLLSGQIALRLGDGARARERAVRLSRVFRSSGAAGLPPEIGLPAVRLQRAVGLNAEARDTLEQVAAGSASTLANTTDPALLLELARIDLADGDPGVARRSVDRLIAADPDTPERRLIEAELLLREHQPEQALVRLDDWLEDHPGDTRAGLLRANVLLTLDRTRAIEQYEAMADRDNPVVLNNLAWLYMENGDERAVATAERAMALAPDNADIADTLGWILVQNGQPERAIELIRRSSEHKPGNATVRYHLGVAYLDAGRVAAGRAALEEAMGLGPFPEREDAERRLAALPEV